MSVALTKREKDITQRLLNGAANKTVARELGISPRTVEVHRANVLRKTEKRNLVALATSIANGETVI